MLVKNHFWMNDGSRRKVLYDSTAVQNPVGCIVLYGPDQCHYHNFWTMHYKNLSKTTFHGTLNTSICCGSSSMKYIHDETLAKRVVEYWALIGEECQVQEDVLQTTLLLYHSSR